MFYSVLYPKLSYLSRFCSRVSPKYLCTYILFCILFYITSHSPVYVAFQSKVYLFSILFSIIFYNLIFISCNIYSFPYSDVLQGRRALLQFEVMKIKLVFRVTEDVQVVEAERVTVEAKGVEVETERVEVEAK